jgi:hypothetical protein
MLRRSVLRAERGAGREQGARAAPERYKISTIIAAA